MKSLIHPPAGDRMKSDIAEVREELPRSTCAPASTMASWSTTPSSTSNAGHSPSMTYCSLTKNQTSETELEPKANSAADMPKHLQKPRLRRWEASEYMEFAHGLTMAPATLAKLASIGAGPGFHRVGRIPLYLAMNSIAGQLKNSVAW